MRSRGGAPPRGVAVAARPQTPPIVFVLAGRLKKVQRRSSHFPLARQQPAVSCSFGVVSRHSILDIICDEKRLCSDEQTDRMQHRINRLLLNDTHVPPSFSFLVCYPFARFGSLCLPLPFSPPVQEASSDMGSSSLELKGGDCCPPVVYA